jgi:hypothetical protein
MKGYIISNNKTRKMFYIMNTDVMQVYLIFIDF